MYTVYMQILLADAASMILANEKFWKEKDP